LPKNLGTMGKREKNQKEIKKLRAIFFILTFKIFAKKFMNDGET
jgi:hypothetical protein